MLVGSGRAAPKWGAQRPKSGAQRRPKAQRAQRAAPRRGAGGTCPLHAKNDLPLLPKSRFCRIDRGRRIHRVCAQLQYDVATDAPTTRSTCFAMDESTCTRSVLFIAQYRDTYIGIQHKTQWNTTTVVMNTHDQRECVTHACVDVCAVFGLYII